MKKIFIVFMLVLGVVSFSKERLNIGLVMSSGGLGTGFNQMAYSALVKLEDEGKVNFKYVEPNNTNEDFDYLRDFSHHGDYDLVIAMGSVVAKSLEEIVKIYPNQDYVLVSSVKVDNTIVIDFAEEQSSFLAGALAAMMSDTGVVGTIPAIDKSVFDGFRFGFSAGAHYVDRDIKVLNTYMPTTSGNPFNDPVKCKNIANLMMARGADVIMHIAEGSGKGLFEAARENNRYAIGSDVDEDSIVPGSILTSVRNRIDIGLYNVINEVYNDGFKAEYRLAGLEDGAVSLTDFNETRDIIGDKKLRKLEKIREDIISGKIDVIALLEREKSSYKIAKAK